MTTDSQPHLSLSHLRHELRTPINAIVGYSEMIMEEFEYIDLDVAYLQELQEIRDCGAKLLVSINNFLNPAIPPTTQLELKQIITNPDLKSELKKPTVLVISNCQQLIPLIEREFVSDVEKINLAANKLLDEIENLLECLPLEESDISRKSKNIAVVEEKYFLEAETESQENLDIDLIIDSGMLLAQEEEQPLEPAKYKILIVDDNATNRDLLSRQVKAQGYQVGVAKDGKQAIEAIKTGVYDLILLDIIMPHINGYEVLKWIRAGAW